MQTVLTPQLRFEIKDLIDERIQEKHIRREDFSELKEIVRDLSLAQKRTDIKMGELAEAQKRTEVKVEELAEAQKRTENKLERVEAAVEKLAVEAKGTRQELGGLSRSFGYAFENEAYRMLPTVLKDRYAIEIKEKVIRKEIGGKEINILGKGRRDGKEIMIVGEAKLRLDEKGKRAWLIFEELDEKVEAVNAEYKEEAVKILVTHYATPGFIKKAEEEGVIVVQSFEW